MMRRIRKEGVKAFCRRGSTRVPTERRYVRRVMREEDHDSAPGGITRVSCALGLV